MNKILIADDDQEILTFLTYNFEKENFRVHKASNGEEAVEKAKIIKPDIILMDLMMPVMDGVEATYHIKNNEKLNSIPIIMVSARSEDYSIIAGLDGGADDYVVKPVRFKVLLKKIESLLKRRSKTSKANLTSEYNDGRLYLNRASHEVKFNGEPIELANKEFDLVSLLVTQPEKVFSREEILTKIWNREVLVGERTIDVHVRKLRSKFGKEFIKTVNGVGYKYIVRKSEEQKSSSR
ncbi:response regulator transcription factor [Parvicella tangerina]|uniref:Transcriptional regulatory protein SrrA n=1 Tax=Parvicella tangerina TaxID=2829795 RepID=A0A916NQM7_9FLAO|nr:response regulator transcription factor [Parvicella tangerina]CAG5079500.1 Transcriptional regulatory protein SrrA [Parvicella tangerina]